MPDREPIDRAAQESWEDQELVPDMPPDAHLKLLDAGAVGTHFEVLKRG